ncbi:T9SS type A sorting domain-containing protein [Owenweeksia hongkongensis]|uniref:T9SS type A sorting domain-containing protein n=1 Tax=Owenweeksia hongkongensis TaxID=253245 RepID=UPI003A94CE93
MKNYYYILMALFLTSNNLSATIQYTDLTPDSTASVGTGNYLDIDINGNNNEDFTFTLNGIGASMYSIGISTTHDIYAIHAANNTYYAAALWAGYSFGSSSYVGGLWADYTKNVKLDDNTNSPFKGAKERFIGFRLEDSGNYYYGWILVELTAGLELKIKSFAYEDVANTPILVGDTGSKFISLSESEVDGVKLYPSIVSDYLNISSNSIINEIRIFSLIGTEVYTVSPNKSEVELNLSKLTSGQYILRLTNSNGQVSTQKFVRRD